MRTGRTHNTIGRRGLLKGAVTLAGGAAAGALASGAAAQNRTGGGGPAIVVASDSTAVVETTAGSVRGYIQNGIHTFKGIPYGASTEANARFLPPARPKSWTGVRSCMQYGPVCPQVTWNNWANDETAFLLDWDEGKPGEDCLRVNIWTPMVNDGRKRPVMVWLHGGDFIQGSGQELREYDGENLARRGEVVVVTLNHRLNALGHLNLAEYGEKYAGSGNAGMLDLVLALEWVRDNIVNFGGDPGKVMIYGYSGGGSKVSALMAMPVAKGLFHRASIQSADLGANVNQALRQLTMEDSTKLAQAVVAELGLSRARIDEIQTVPYQRLWDAGKAAVKRIPGLPHAGWGPVVDGAILPRHPFDPDAPAVSANVPLLIGTVLNESSGLVSAEMELRTEEEVKRRLADRLGARSEKIVEVARRVYPNAKPIELQALILGKSRAVAIAQAERKAALKAAPAYMYLFSWHTSVLNGRPRAFHGSELAFVFYNTDRCAHWTGGTDEARELAAKVSDAWINFARKGDPNHKGLPGWPVFAAAKGPTMIFDKKCEVRNDPDRELRDVLTA